VHRVRAFDHKRAFQVIVASRTCEMSQCQAPTLPGDSINFEERTSSMRHIRLVIGHDLIHRRNQKRQPGIVSAFQQRKGAFIRLAHQRELLNPSKPSNPNGNWTVLVSARARRPKTCAFFVCVEIMSGIPAKARATTFPEDPENKNDPENISEIPQ